MVKNKVIRARVTESEKAKFIRLSKQFQLSESELLRKIIQELKED